MGNLQSIARPTTDTVFSWISNEHSIKCQCRLRIFTLSDSNHLVIISALPDYPGASFTQSLQQVIFQISYSFDLPLNQTMWVEHYPASRSTDPDFYYHLLLAWHNVSWHQIRQPQLKAILKQTSYNSDC